MFKDDFTNTLAFFPKLIETFEEIPLFFQDHITFSKERIPFTIYVPPNKYMKTRASLIWLESENLCVLEKKFNRIDLKKINFSTINYIEKGESLLLGWITLVTNDEHYQLKYNTVREDLFVKIFNHLRNHIINANLDIHENTITEEQRALIDALNPEVKFINFSKFAIDPSQSVHNIFYKENFVVEPQSNLLKKKLFNYQTTAQMHILTDNELIILKEENKSIRTKRDKCKMITTFIPISRISNITLKHAEQFNSEHILSIYFKDSTNSDFHFFAESEEIDKLSNLYSHSIH